MAEPNRKVFGPIEISWDPTVAFPIAVNHNELNGTCALVTVCDITFRRAGTDYCETVKAGFCFDGASIPRWFWIVPGFAPLGKHLWAALLHDWLCEKAKRGEFDRELADAIFAALLKHTDVGFWRGLVMDLAVSGYRRSETLRKPREVPK